MATAHEIAELSRKIFQRLPLKNIRTGNKLISAQLKGEKVASWFMKPLALQLGGDDPVFEMNYNEQKNKLEQMKRRGKATPKKGQGKRAGKK